MDDWTSNQSIYMASEAVHIYTLIEHRWWKRKFHIWNFRSRSKGAKVERKFHGAKVPHLSFPGVNGFGSEKTSYPSDTGYRGDGTISRVSPQVLYVHHETRENLLSQISQCFLSCWISIVKQTPTNSLFFVKMSCLFHSGLQASCERIM